MENYTPTERLALTIDGYERSRTGGIRAVVKAADLLDLAVHAHANGRDAITAEYIDRALDHCRDAIRALSSVDVP